MFAAGRISVIIPAYQARHVSRVIDAVRALDPIEILVVDSSPTPSVFDDPLVTVVRCSERLPAGAARNRGARQASGEYLLFLDADVVLTEHGRAFVHRRIAEGARGVVSGVYTQDGPGGKFSWLQNCVLRYRQLDAADLRHPLFSSSHFLVRRDTWRGLGGFNEEIATYEDVEFFARCGKLGLRPETAEEFEAIHLKEYAPLTLLKDYGHKSYNAFLVRRRYPHVFLEVPSLLGRPLQLILASGFMFWIFLAAAIAGMGLPVLIAAAVAFVLPHRLSRQILGESHAGGALSLLWFWPLLSATVAGAVGAAVVVWTARGLRNAFYLGWDMLRALKRVLIRTGLPVQIIAYVTARCNLRCEHCFYKETLDNPNRGELSLDVFRRTTASVGPVLWFSLAGGEPFVRKDLAELIDVVQKNCRPKVFSFPTNGWYTEQTFEACLRVLQRMETGNLILFFSLDGPREMHDTIRGAGSFDRVKATMARLRPLTAIYPNLYLNVITTVTERNADVSPAFIDELVRDFGPSAISINLFRYHSLEHPAIPAAVIDGYKATVDAYSKYLREGALKHYGFFGGRVLLVKEILQKELIYRVAKFNEFVTPCTAGTLSYVIMEDGRVTPCEILPDSIGNVTGPASFREMVTGTAAKRLRTWIADTECKCTWECAMSTNTLFSWPMSKRMIKSLAGDLVFGKAAT